MPIAFTPSPFCPAFRRVPLSSHKGGALLDYWPREGAATVLFVPGTMLGPLQYRVFLHALYEQGLAVAALHLTGHGATRHILSFRLPQLLDDLRQAVVHLRQRHSGPLLLCGHSQGGIMTLALACGGSLPDGNGRHIAFAPLDGVAAFFAVSAVFPQHDDIMRLTLFAPLLAHRHRIQEKLLRLARRFPALPLPLFSYLSPRRLLAGHGSIDLPLAGRRLTYPLGLLADLLALRLNEMTARPFFLLGARNDALFTPDILQATLDRLDAPHKALHLLPTGGHMLLMQRGTAREAAAFLALNACALDLPLQCGYAAPKD
ncbi:alpha/beta fold hydrolase [uncultured Desulfovibrio sp.]|uniref:alpha/beta hydrolase n=1 Tax=uncultured Desulfovibrio sp. TaxID=167968 RepID=UPI00261B5B33|nr:alpha/beta fold hydrolase [uncultured Desulfovibrio sp.]